MRFSSLSALNYIAAAQAKLGQIAEAEKTAARISDKHLGASAFVSVAAAQLKAGDIAGAKATLSQRGGSWEGSRVYRSIALAEISANDLAGAKVSVTHVREGRAEILRKLAGTRRPPGTRQAPRPPWHKSRGSSAIPKRISWR